MTSPAFDSVDVQDGQLPPWEIAKAIAYHTVLHDISANLNCPCHELIGKRVDDYIAEHVLLKGGGHPTARSVRRLVLKCSDPSWFSGKAPVRTGGRPLVYSKHQNAEVARVAMELKRKRVAPCPRQVRARLPSVARNPETLKPMSNKAIRPRLFAGVAETAAGVMCEAHPREHCSRGLAQSCCNRPVLVASANDCTAPGGPTGSGDGLS